VFLLIERNSLNFFEGSKQSIKNITLKSLFNPSASDFPIFPPKVKKDPLYLIISKREKKMETITIIKMGLMMAFFLEVVIFGKFVSALKCFEESEIMSIAMTFSGALFISIAFLDIIPEAIANLDEYLN
jgi:hypothetical protein